MTRQRYEPGQPMREMTRLTESLALLQRLNEARRIRQSDAAQELETELDDQDLRHGYDRLAAEDTE